MAARRSPRPSAVTAGARGGAVEPPPSSRVLTPPALAPAAATGRGSAAEGAATSLLPASEVPTERTLAAWFTRQWNKWQPVRDRDDAIRERVNRVRRPTHVGEQGEGGELLATVVRSGTLRTLEREFVGILSSVPPRFEALAKGIGPRHQRAASEIEDWVDAWYKAVKGNRATRLADTNVVRYGRAVFFVVWAQQFWRGMPVKDEAEADAAYTRRVGEFKRGAPPAVVVVERPAPQCMHDEDEWSPFLGPARACFWELRPLSELAARYPDSRLAVEYAQQRNALDFADDSRLHVCWANRRYLVYATAGGILTDPERGERVPASLTQTTLHSWEVVDTYTHGLGRNPFVVQESGPSDDPELVFRYEGFFDNCQDLIDRVDDALTQLATNVRRYTRAMPIVKWAWPPGGAGLPPGIDPAKVVAQPIVWDPDRPRAFLPGQEPGWWQQDAAALRGALEYLDILERYIQRDTLAPSQYGQAPRTNSGFQLVTAIEAGERKLTVAVQAKEEAQEAIVDVVLRWVAHIGAAGGGAATGVAVRAVVTEEGSGGALGTQIVREDTLVLTADQARTASVAAHVEVRLDVADAASAQIGLQISQVMAEGGIDVDPAWILSRWFHLENPERHQKAAELWRFLKSPELRNWVVRQALEEAGMLVERDEAEWLQQLALLSDEELLLVPQALQQVLAAKGLVPGAPGLPGGGGAMPGGPAVLGGSPQLAATLAGAAPPGAPNPMTAAMAPGAPRMPGLGMAPAAAAPDIIGLGLGGLTAQMRAGMPRTPREAGSL